MRLLYGVVYAHQTGPVGEYCFYLQKVYHVGHAFHHILFLEYVGGVVHHFFYSLACAGALKCA